MVREARFAFDDDFEETDPHQDPDFTDEDDRFLDAFSQPEDRSRPRKARSKKTNPREKSEQAKRHLSDADWLSRDF